VIGNEKGSAIKFMILFQEIIFNAVKYSAFVGKEDRRLSIRLDVIAGRISLQVENRFKAGVRPKTTGIGHTLIKNFSKLLNTAPVIKRERGLYSVEINFPNFWEAGAYEDTIC